MKNLFLTFLVTFVTYICFSQDVLVLKDGSKIEAKIVEITTTSIKYYKFSQLEGPIRIAEKYEVSEIIYQNGDSEKFDVPVPITKPTQGRNETIKPPKPVKDPVLQRGFFIEGLFGISELSRTETYYNYIYPGDVYQEYSYLQRDTYFSIGMRIGNKWYFGKNEKWRLGFQASWLRFDVHIGNGIEDLIMGPRTISIANIGMCNVIKFSDKLAMEANFLIGPAMYINADNGYAVQGYSFSIDSKIRLNTFSLGLDYQYGGLQSNVNYNRNLQSHILSVTVGRKF
jgi:hypothetical protein